MFSLFLQVTCIVSGSGRVQAVGVGSRRVLETTDKAGQLFIDPMFFVVSKICDFGMFHLKI